MSYVEGEIGGRYGTAGEGAIQAQFRDQYATIRFPSAAEPRFLVVNERYDPYWRAYVDGKRATVYPTNVAMRGVIVPPGAGEVSMIYRPYDTSGRAWVFYAGGLVLFGLGYWSTGRVDRRFATLSLAELARPLRRRWSSIATRLVSWTTGDERALLRTLLALAAIWAAVVCVRYRREPAFLLFALACPIAGLMLVRLDARLAGAAASARDRLATIAAFLFMLAIWSASFLLWRRAGGFFGIRDTGESAAIYLSSFQVRGIVSFFLQEHAASSDPAAWGYYYIHHPNLISRLLAMIGIALGMSQEKLILGCLMLSALSLLPGFLGLARLFGPIAGLAAIGFFATSYGVYFAEGGDLLRGLHAVMLWLLVYLTALECHAAATGGRGRNVALAALFVCIASSDWAFLLFCLAFYAMWSTYAQGRLPVGHLCRWVLLPIALTFLVYFGATIVHTGFKFFMTDMLVTYFGRMGNVLSGPLLGQVWNPSQFLELYRAKHIVMWDVNPAPVKLRDIVTAYWEVMSGGGLWIARLLFMVFVACAAATLLRISGLRLVRIAALGAVGTLACGFVEAPLALALIAYLLFGLPRLGARSRAARLQGEASPVSRLFDLSVWITIVLAAMCVVALVLPDYVSWLWEGGVSPVGMADAAAFALICHLLAHLGHYGEALEALRTRAAAAVAALPRLWLAPDAADRKSVERQGAQPWQLRIPGGAAAIAFLAGLHLFGNLQLYRQIPPLGPPFAATLREPQFHGKLFVSNVYDALVWYFTRGTSLVATVVPPDEKDTLRFRHVRDGDDAAKYAHPEYLLCDNDPYFAFQRVARVGGKLCQMPSECSCQDVMREMLQQGHSPVVVAPDYVIMKYNYAK